MQELKRLSARDPTLTILVSGLRFDLDRSYSQGAKVLTPHANFAFRRGRVPIGVQSKSLNPFLAPP